MPILISVAGACLIGLLVYGVSTQSASRTLDTDVHQGLRPAAPDAHAQLPVLGGHGEGSLAAQRGKVVVLNFWASWCVDCKLEAKTLHDAAEAAGKDVVFVGVDGTDFSSAARRYMRRYGIDYPVVRDVDGSAKSTWGVTGFPETFFISPAGKVVRHVVGPITPQAQFSPKDMQQTIRQLLS